MEEKIKEYSGEKKKEEEGGGDEGDGMLVQNNSSLQDIRILNLKERRSRRRKTTVDEISDSSGWNMEQIQMEYAVLKVKRSDNQLLVGCAKGLKIFSMENRKLLFDLSYFNQQVKSI